MLQLDSGRNAASWRQRGSDRLPSDRTLSGYTECEHLQSVQQQQPFVVVAAAVVGIAAVDRAGAVGNIGIAERHSSGSIAGAAAAFVRRDTVAAAAVHPVWWCCIVAFAAYTAHTAYTAPAERDSAAPSRWPRWH